MDSEFWLRRWREGNTRWHQGKVLPLLQKHWPALDVKPGSRVLVPLCGKSLDMPWLSAQGLHVLGVDVSAIAVEAFLTENQLHAVSSATPEGTLFKITNPPGGCIEIMNGDLFELAATTVADCNVFYDRAATIAMPAELRSRMASEVYAKLPAGSRGLLITLEYPQPQMDGPPFAVDEPEVRRLFEADWEIELLERRDILASQPQFAAQGLSSLHTALYALRRRNDKHPL